MSGTPEECKEWVGCGDAEMEVLEEQEEEEEQEEQEEEELSVLWIAFAGPMPGQRFINEKAR